MLTSQPRGMPSFVLATMLSDVAGSSYMSEAPATVALSKTPAPNQPSSPSLLCPTHTRPLSASAARIGYAVPTVGRLLQE